MEDLSVDLLERLQTAPGAEIVLPAVADEPVYAVGGAVRDALLGRIPRELDLVVEGDAIATARRAAARIDGELAVHERFGTATVRAEGYEFDLAGARRETYARPGALPDVELGATLEQDLARRDFTVNAIAVRLSDGALTEWPGARDDLEARPPARPARALLRATIPPACCAASATRRGSDFTLETPDRRPRCCAPSRPTAPATRSSSCSTSPSRPRCARLADDRARAGAVRPRLRRPRLGAAGPARPRRRLPQPSTTSRPSSTSSAFTGQGPHDRRRRRHQLRPSSLTRRAQRRRAVPALPPRALETAQLLEAAGDQDAHRWLHTVRHRALKITGDDLIAAGAQRRRGRGGAAHEPRSRCSTATPATGPRQLAVATDVE